MGLTQLFGGEAARSDDIVGFMDWIGFWRISWLFSRKDVMEY